MVTTTRPTHHGSTTVVRGPESAPAAEFAQADVEGTDFDEDLAYLLQGVSAQQIVPARRSFVSMLVQGLKGFWADMAGPALSGRERTQRALDEDKFVKYASLTGSRIF